jgi:hypothetical protein
MMRKQLADFVALGVLPSEKTATVNQMEKIEAMLASIEKPLSEEEAAALIPVLGDDNCFGVAKSVLQLIESTPGWPLPACLLNTSNKWVAMLIQRADSAKAQ